MKELYPILMNPQFERIALIDDYSSFIWSTRYYTSGDFQLIVNVNPSNTGLFQKDWYIVRDDDENVGLIEDITITRNENGVEQYIIKGRFIDSIIGRRIIARQTTVSGNVGACIKQLLMDNIVDPAMADRQISNFLIGDIDVSGTMAAQFTGKNLLDTISNICQTYGIGYKVTLDSNHNFVFSLYTGVNRTYDQSVNPWVIFSDTYDNLLSSQYEENYKSLTNAVLVAGEGEGLDRKTIWVSDGSTGINRHEAYSDARNIRSDGDISESDYLQLLAESGKEDLTTYTSAFTGKVYFDSVSYKDDIGMGDLCVIENTEWGIYMNTRLMEVVESVDESGQYSITPTFGV